MACQEYEPFTKADIYASQFEQYIGGGGIHPEQTWGFYDIPKTMIYTRALSEDEMLQQYNNTNPFTFYKTETFYKYSSDLDALKERQNVEIINTDYVGDSNSTNASYYEFGGKGTIIKWNCWQGYREIYVTGDVTFDNNGTQQAIFYVLPGASLTIGGGYINNLEIYVSPEGKLNYDFDKIDGSAGNGKIFNAGTFIYDRDKFTVANYNGLFYNEGYAEVNHLIASGNPSFIYNYGELKVTGELYLENAGCLYNGGKIEVDGDTHFTNDLVWWVNNGHYYTTNMNFSAGHEDAYNFCQLLVDGNFNFSMGTFNLMHNSYVEAKSAEFKNFTVHMYGHSGINITEESIFHSNTDGHNQGFHGDDVTWSYVRLGGVTKAADNGNCLVIMGKIAYAIEELVDNSIDNEGHEATFFDPETTLEIPFDKMDAYEHTDECYVDWTPNFEEATSVRVIVEDLPGSITNLKLNESDFDYNDAVFDVTFRDTKIDITVHACGGTLPLYVADREVHGLFGLPTTSYPLINKNKEKTPVTFTIERGIYNNANDIPVYVENEGEKYEITAFKGEAPAKICVGTDYVWCDEGVDIKKTYPKFVDWATKKEYDNNQWYQEQ